MRKSEPMTYRTTYLPVSMQDELRELADAQRRSVAELIRKYVAEGLKRERAQQQNQGR